MGLHRPATSFLASLATAQEEPLPIRAIEAVFLPNGHMLRGGALGTPSVFSLPPGEEQF